MLLTSAALYFNTIDSLLSSGECLGRIFTLKYVFVFFTNEKEKYIKTTITIHFYCEHSQ